MRRGITDEKNYATDAADTVNTVVMLRSSSDATEVRSMAHRAMHQRLGVRAPGVVSSDEIHAGYVAELARRRELGMFHLRVCVHALGVCTFVVTFSSLPLGMTPIRIDHALALRQPQIVPSARMQRQLLRTYLDPRSQIDADVFTGRTRVVNGRGCDDSSVITMMIPLHQPCVTLRKNLRK